MNSSNHLNENGKEIGYLHIDTGFSLLFPTFNFFACSSFCCVEQIVDDDKFYASDNCKPFIFYENFIIVLAVVADEIDLSSNDCEPSLLPDFKFSLPPPDFFNYFS